MTETTPVELYKALLKAQQAIKPVAKDAENTFHQYSYASAEHMMIEARKALNDSGLVVAKGDSKLDYEKSPVLLRCEFFLIYPETGQSLSYLREWPVIVQKGRELDKAQAAAETSCQSYFLRDLLLIPRVSPDEEMDNRADTEQPTRPATRQPAPQQDDKIKGEDIEYLKNMINMTGANLPDFLSYFKVTSLGNLTQSQFKLANIMLQKKLAEKTDDPV